VGKEGREGGEDWRSAEVQRLGMEVLPRTWLVPVILLSLRECSSYGYELMERASAFGFEAVNPGTLYRTLRQMEKDGLCESEWDTNNGGGPARRMYSINDAGKEYLGFWAESLDQYRQKMDAFLRLYTGGQGLTDQEKDVG
jgi:PadR family transcriptional regulator, regulatory protein PadR